MTFRLSKNFHGVGIGPLSKILAVKGHFSSVAKVALRFGCAKQSKNLEWYLMFTHDLALIFATF